MTARQEYNRILSAEALQSSPIRSFALSAIQAKAQPSLRAGAGGVGGLVAVSVDGDFYFPGYDNNGNVIGYWNETGSLVAEYAYDAFGNTIAATGSMSDVFPHRFSTKYYDAETDLYYYGYRYYSPSLGRWISRDPIEENGGKNIYSYCCNQSNYLYDYLGLKLTHAYSETESSWSLTITIPIEIIDCVPERPRKSDDEIKNEIQKCWTKSGTYMEMRTFPINENLSYDKLTSVKANLKVEATVRTVSKETPDPNIHTFMLVNKNVKNVGVAKRDTSHATIGGTKAEIYIQSRTNIGTFVHEFGHWLGLRDKYFTKTEGKGPNKTITTFPQEGFSENVMADNVKRGVTGYQIYLIKQFVFTGAVEEP